jgi:hypothetical protein
MFAISLRRLEPAVIVQNLHAFADAGIADMTAGARNQPPDFSFLASAERAGKLAARPPRRAHEFEYGPHDAPFDVPYSLSSL